MRCACSFSMGEGKAHFSTIPSSSSFEMILRAPSSKSGSDVSVSPSQSMRACMTFARMKEAFPLRLSTNAKGSLSQPRRR